jgi:hypothetical protein
VPNKSQILRALEWVDRAANEGDVDVLARAKLALEDELATAKSECSPEDAYETALNSFVRKHGREPLEDIVAVE